MNSLVVGLLATAAHAASLKEQKTNLAQTNKSHFWEKYGAEYDLRAPDDYDDYYYEPESLDSYDYYEPSYSSYQSESSDRDSYI